MIAYRQRGFINFYQVFVGLIAITLLLGYAAVLPWLPWVDLSENVNLTPYVLAVAVGVLVGGRLFHPYSQRLHSLHGSEALTLGFQQVAYVGACVFTLMFATKDREVSRLFLGSYLLFLGLLLSALHGRFPAFFARILFADNARARTLFVGRETSPDKLLSWMREREHLGILPLGYLTDVSTEGVMLPELPRLGSVIDMRRVMRERQINQVILLDWLDDPAEMERMVETCEMEGCRLLIHNDFGSKFARNFTAVQEGGEQFFALQDEPLEDPANRAVKRLLDLVIALPIVVLVLPPLFAIVWLVQRFQAPGPVLFMRPRGGQNRREFPMLKFRSMYVNNPDVNEQAKARDSRIYPFGRFLRKTSLDEFPQFINVLLGQMSVVGPRPHLPQHDEEFSKIDHSYRIRGLVKPGVTGLAQIKGFRGEITDPEKLRRRVYWDLYYVTNWTFAMDVRIIVRTFWVVLFPPKTAY